MHASPSATTVLFVADGCIVAAAGWLLALLSGHARRSVLEAFITWLGACLALVTAVGLVLGLTGGFGQPGFLLGHAAVAAVLALGSGHVRMRLRDAAAVLRQRCEEAQGFLSTRSAVTAGAWALLMALAALAVLDVFVPPTIMDTLSYHLPRVGVWLQEGRMVLIGGADARMDFVASLPEVVMAWLATGTTDGFGPVVLLQIAGGVLLVAATVGLARKTGLSPRTSLLAAALLFGMQNVVSQFTAAQTDLYTGGLLAGAFYLWWCGLDRGEVSVAGALGAGLALGAKGTLFYLVPGALLWVAVLTWRSRPTWRWWTLTLGWGAAGVLFFAGPGFVRNFHAYGNLFGPAEWVGRVHGNPAQLQERGRMLALNATTSLGQNLQPAAQPQLLRPVAKALGENLATRLPDEDPYTLDHAKRKAVLAELLGDTMPDADATAFGVVTLLLATLGVAVALVQSARPDARLVLAWAAGVLAFLGYFHAMQLWHPFAFRYFVLVAPWLAVISAWGIAQLPRCGRLLLWTVALAATAEVAWTITVRTPLAGWLAVRQPEKMPAYFVMQKWREWSRQLGPAGSPLAVLLPENRPVAAFFRQEPSRRVKILPASQARTAEELVRGTTGWTIVPASQFSAHEGDVVERVWLFKGNSASGVSLAAFRARIPGEIAEPLLYYTRVTAKDGAVVHSMLVKTWAEPRVAFAVLFPEGGTYEVQSPSGHAEGNLPAGERARVTVELPPNSISEVRWILRGRESSSAVPSVALLP